MRRSGTIIIRGIVQGVGFRPFVYAKAREFGITGTVKNLGSEVEIHASGERFEEFLEAVSRGTPLSRIDSVDVYNLRDGQETAGFTTVSYTHSDAADERSSVDLGGRRIIKKKKKMKKGWTE